jgi:hypothetical protein
MDAGDRVHRTEAVPQPERVTVNLTGKAVQALQRLQELTGYNKTDCINRALIIAADVEGMSRHPGAVYWRENPDSDLMLVRFV